VEIKLVTTDLMSVAQAGKALGKPRLAIYRWIKAGKVHAVKLGGFLYVPKSEVERLQHESDRAKGPKVDKQNDRVTRRPDSFQAQP